MDDKHRNLLNVHRSKFIQCVDVERLIPFLQDNEVITPEDVQHIRGGNSPGVNVERLLDILPNRGCQAFQTLCLALETTYPHLVTVMFLGTNQQRPPRPLSGPPIQMRNLDFESDPGSDRDSDRGMHGHVISPHDYDLQQSNLALLRAELRLVTHDRDALRKQLQKLMARQGMSSEKIVNGGYFGPLDNRDGTLSRSSGGSLFSNSGSEHSLQEDYESLKHQCERAKVELQTLRRQHSRCESMSKDCEYLRKQGQEAMSKLEAANSNVHALRAQVNDLVANRDRLEQEVASLQKSREEDQKEAVELRRQHQAAMKENGSAETINQLYLQALRKYEALKDDHDSLRKRHTDVISQYSAAASKLELSQEEVARLKLQYEESIQERNAAVRERNQFNKQCTAAIRQWDNALRENSELKEQISKMQQQHDEAMKELNQVLNSRLKHLAEERNSIKQEYRLVMGERDNVHKEIERLQDELSKATMTKKMLEGSNKEYSEELESLKREITVALHDRDRALKEINDLRQRLGGKADGLGPGDREPRHSFEASKENRDVSGHYDGADSLDSQRVEKLENLDQANQEVEKLRKLVEKLKAELKDALQEAEVSKRRRNWAFGERDKIVLERESIRTLCDKLRRERDRAVSDLAEALRDSDDMKKQRNAFSKEIKELRELLEAQEQEMRLQQRNTSSSLTNTFSRDSAIDSDMAEWESTTLHFSHMELGVHNLGVEISLEGARGGNNLPIVTAVAPSSPLYGKLLVSDKLVRINDHDCMGMVPANALNLLQKAPENLQVLVQRRRMPRGVHLVQLVLKGGIMGLGISWENGIYICRISSGSPAAREGTLSIGDRLIMVNQKSVEGMTVGEVEKHLASWKESTVTLSVAKFSPHAARSVFSSLPSSPLDTTQEEKLDAASISTGGGEIGSQELDSGDSSRELHGIGITNGLGLGTRRDVATSPLSGLESEAEKESSSRGSSSREALTHGKGNRGVMRRLINSSSQTNSSNQPEEVKHRSNERVYTVKKAGGEKGSNSGIRDILKERFIPEFVRVRRQSKERRGPSESSPSSSGKKSFRNSTPSPFEREKEDAIAELDSVIANYQPKGSGTAKRIRRRPVEHVEIEPHGTWPKYRGAPSSAYDSVLYTGTIFPRTQGRKDRSRAPLSSVFPCTVVTSSASAPPYQCAPMHHYDYAPSPFMSSLEQKSPGSGRDLEHNHERISALTPSDTSLDYSVRSASCKKEILEYYVKKKGSSSSKGGGQCQSDSESNLSPVESTTNLGGSGGSGSGSTYGYSTPTHHLRVHSQLYPGPTYMSYPVPMPMPIPHPHPHPHSASARYRAVSPTASLPMTMSRSGDSILSSATHERSFHDVGPYVSSPHAPMYHPGIQAGDLGCPYRPGPGGAPRPLSMHPTHLLYQDDYGHQVYHAEFPQAGTFPRKKDNQRIRIPSNQSVTSKSSAGKLTGSIEQGISDRGSSPMPTFHVETLGKPSSSYWRCKKPSPGELRSVYIEKSSEPLGISISCLNNKGVFVASVAEKSLAERVGLQVGDQLLEVCGINMRNATNEQAARVLRQCGDSITMLIQYSPDKFHEGEEGSTSSGGGHSRSESPTPCNSPKSGRAPAPLTLDEVSPSATSTLRAPLSMPTSASSSLTHHQINEAIATLHSKKKTDSSGPGEEKSDGEKGYPPASLTAHEPRLVLLNSSNSCSLGVTLVGGNAVGIFIHSVLPDSPAYKAGLRCGDRLLKFHGADLRSATAEQAAYELAKPAENVDVLAQYDFQRYMEIQNQPGDGFYVRVLFDPIPEPSSSRDAANPPLNFSMGDILYVDNTVHNGIPGQWSAWKVDPNGHKQEWGIIASKYKMEEKLLLLRSLGELDCVSGDGSSGSPVGGSGGSRRGSTTARRSFIFRRKKPQRGSSAGEAKELASFSDASLHTYGDTGLLNEEPPLPPPTYQRVERLNCLIMRPVLIIGPLADFVSEKMVQEYPHKFAQCIPEVVRGSPNTLESEIIDYKRRGSHFECLTIAAICEVSDRSLHCILDMSLSAVERLQSLGIYPLVFLIKFKSPKQIREVKDTRLTEKLSAKVAKEVFEHGGKIEAEFKPLISAVIHAAGNLSYICTQVASHVEQGQRSTLWVPSPHPLW